MGKKLIALLVALSLSAGACGGGDDDKATETSDTSAAPGDTTSTTGPSDAAAGGGGGSSAGGGGGSTATTAAGGGGGGGTATTVRPGSSSSSAARTAAPGRYVYRRTGERTTGTTKQSLDGEGTLTVSPPNGTDQHAKTEYTESVSEQTLRHRTGGIDLLYLRTEVRGFAAYEFRPSPPVLFAPDPANVGATWSWRITSTDGVLTVDGSFKVVRTETLTIGGEAVPTTVVEGTLSYSGGGITGTSKQTIWGSPQHRLAVRLDDASDFGFAQSTSSAVLTSTKPR